MPHKTLRCKGSLHGVVVDNTYLEVKCGRRICGHRPEVVVLHKFNLKTGELVDTRRFRNPRKEIIR